MSHWIDDQAEESDHEDEGRPVKKRARIGSDDDDDEEEEDESKIAEEMKGFVVTGDDDEDEGEDDEADKKSESEESGDGELEEDEQELIAENLGQMTKKKPRHVILGSDEEEEDDEADRRQALERQLFSGAEDEPRRPKPARPPREEEEEEEIHSGSEESDINDFIDEEGQEEGVRRPKIKSQKRRLPVSDHAMEEAREIFGGDFAFDDFADEYAEEDEVEEEEEEVDEIGEDGEERRVTRKVTRRKPPRRTLLEHIEPSDLERGFLSELDEKIQKEDRPERHQLRSVPVARADESELTSETTWIFSRAFCDSGCVTQQDNQNQSKPVESAQIKATLNFIRNQDFEVPYIAFYLKEYVETLNIFHMWKVYHWDEKWCELQTRKKNLCQLFERMRDYQFNVIMEDPLRSTEEIRAITDEDTREVFLVESQEELHDVYSYFLLYYGRDVPKMTAYEKIREAQERGDDAEPTPAPKQASRRDKYSICTNAGLGSLASLFGLTPKQFASNLENLYMCHDVEQHPDEPLRTAESFVSSQFPTPEMVLKGAVYMVAMQLAREPSVRRAIRAKYRNDAGVSVRPTKKGRKEIDENHPIYMHRYLKNKPAREFRHDEFLKLIQAEENGLIKITISVDSAVSKSIIEKPVYRRDEYSKLATEWNALRDEVVTTCIEQILYPILEKELKAKMIQEARDNVLKHCGQKCVDLFKIAPFKFEKEDEDRDNHPPTIMGIAYTKEMDQASFGVVLDQDGEVMDHIRLLHLMKRRNSYREADKRLKEQELETIKRFLVNKNVRIIVVAAEDVDALNIYEDLKSITADLEADGQLSHIIDVEIIENELAKVYMDSKRAQSDYPDYPLLLRQAISLARRMLDALLEFSQLCNQDDEILCLKFHPMQDMISKEDLLQVVTCEFVNRVNEVGVDINRCLEHSHTSSVLQFVCGLGPRKAAYVLKLVRQNGGILETRKQLETIILANQKKVYMNCAGFIKIDTAKVAEKSEVYVDPLDGSRIHPVDGYDWARKMAIDALEYDDMSEDANPAGAIEEILEAPERLKDLDLDAFAEELERQDYGNKHITLYDIRAELNHRYKDMRPKYEQPPREDVFYMLTKETRDTFAPGKLVLGRVSAIAYRRPKADQLEHTNPIRNDQTGLWQCPHCLKNDFFELSAVWTHFDTKQCPGQSVGIRVRLENGVNGFVSTQNISDKGIKNPEERVQIGMPIYCRILKVDPVRFSADLSSRSRDLMDTEKRWRPHLDPYFDFHAEEVDKSEEREQQQHQKKQQYLRRVIAHDLFHNCSFKDAERMLANGDQGDVIIRPSSKGSDHLTVTWKVADGVYQNIDVQEQGKENAFSLGRALYIGNDLFEDLDEIVARHVNPTASNVREILEYKYYYPTSDREEIEKHLRQQKDESQNRIPYVLSASKELPGKFLLSYLPNVTIRHEYVTVLPDGFRYRQKPGRSEANFRSLNDLLKWFKEHYRDPLPSNVRENAHATPMDQSSFMGGSNSRFDAVSHAGSAVGRPVQPIAGWPHPAPIAAPMMAPMNAYGAQPSRFGIQQATAAASSFIAGLAAQPWRMPTNQEQQYAPSTPAGGIRDNNQASGGRRFGKGAADDWADTARNWSGRNRRDEAGSSTMGNPIPHTYDRPRSGGGSGGGGGDRGSRFNGSGSSGGGGGGGGWRR